VDSTLSQAVDGKLLTKEGVGNISKDVTENLAVKTVGNFAGPAVDTAYDILKDAWSVYQANVLDPYFKELDACNEIAKAQKHSKQEKSKNK
jgi:hypothetical protein